MTKRAISEILALFEAAYRIKFAPRESNAWFLLLQTLPDEEGKRSAVELCRKSPYVPKPADVFRLADEYREAHRIPPWTPRLPEPADPETAKKYLEFMREAVEKIGKDIQ